MAEAKKAADVKKAVETKATEVKAAVVKEEEKAKETVKAVETKAKETAKKATTKAKATAAKAKTAAKKTTTAAKKTTTAAKKTVAKAAAAKKTPVAPNVYIQAGNAQAELGDIIERVKARYVAEGGKTISKVDIYLKPEDGAAYYVINGKSAGQVNLF